MVERMVRFLDPDAVKSFFEYVSDTPPNPRFVGGLPTLNQHKADECLYCKAGFTLGSHVRRPAMTSMIVPWSVIRQKLRCGDAAWARIRRLNPDSRGLVIGATIRGYRKAPTTRVWQDKVCMSVKTFIELYGSKAYRQIPKDMFMRHGHRKAVMAIYLFSKMPKTIT